MDITKDNFDASLALVEDTIVRWADFCAIDLEFTGVETCASKNHYLDTINERYKRVVANAPDFIIIQFGLCAFKHDSTTNSYLARPFNFSLFPQSFRTIDKRFVCQASAMQFLSQNNFDFNKWIYKGIPYLSKYQEDLIRKRGPVVPQVHKAPLPLRDSDITFLSHIWEVIDNWQHEGKSESCISLPISSAFQRRLIFQELPKRYPSFTIETIDVSGSRHLRISVADKVLAKERLEQDLQQTIGFRKVIDMLVNAKKQIVGHNLFLDLIMLYQQFQGPLPDTSDAFKSKLNHMFPNVIDTKLMASKCPRIQTTNMEELYNTVCKSPYELPFIGLDSGFRLYLSGNRFHEAGFDAYASGTIYLKLCSSIVTKVLNMIPIPRSDSVLTLDGVDGVPDRSRVFHVYNLPDFNRQIQEERLLKHFGQYGPISITWIDDVSAFVSITPMNSHLDARTREEILATRQFKVTTYEAFHNGQNGKR
jgi:poly(A)-specific ribonuclease